MGIRDLTNTHGRVRPVTTWKKGKARPSWKGEDQHLLLLPSNRLREDSHAKGVRTVKPFHLHDLRTPRAVLGRQDPDRSENIRTVDDSCRRNLHPQRHRPGSVSTVPTHVSLPPLTSSQWGSDGGKGVVTGVVYYERTDRTPMLPGCLPDHPPSRPLVTCFREKVVRTVEEEMGEGRGCFSTRNTDRSCPVVSRGR